MWTTFNRDGEYMTRVADAISAPTATVGTEIQRSLISPRVDVIVVDADSLPRVKETTLPSGEKAGDRSSAGPDTIPGAKSFGLLELAASAPL